MKETEIMIGDFVYQWFRTGSGLHDHREVVCIDGCRMNTIGWEYEPIPLTDEIMLLNGFRKEEWNEPYEDEYYDGYFEPKGCNKYFYVRHRLNVGWYLYNMSEFPVNHVHELQHALRLCGLNELADNFKLKAMEE